MSKEASPSIVDKKKEMPDTILKSKPVRPQKVRRSLTKYSAFLFILVPTLIAAIYFGIIASDKYAVEVRFSIRGVDGLGTTDLIGMVTGTSSNTSTTSDSYILMDYLNSRPLVELLNNKIGLKSMFSSEKADFISAFDTDEPIEKFVDYWKNMISVSYDATSQIIALEFRAFTPHDAQIISETVLSLSEKLVNDLSMKERSDAVRQAEAELNRRQTSLRGVRNELQQFRENERIIDPSKIAESKMQTQSNLEQQVIQSEAELNSKLLFLDENAPTIIALRSKINSLKTQIAEQRLNLSREDISQNGSLSELLENYRELLMDQEFAEKAYTSALTAYEAAQIEASRRQRYLVTFVHPTLPEEATYPKRALNILLSLIISSIIWAIGLLVVYAVRDHAT